MGPHTISTKKKIFFGCIAVVLFLLLSEGILRLASIFFYSSKNFSYQEYNSKYLIGLKPNYQKRGPHGEIVFNINSRGFRGPEFSVPKPVNIYRIMVIGDSTAFGLAQSEDCPYPRQLEMLLSKKPNYKHIEVVNASIEGFSSDLALKRFDEILPLEPDMLIFGIGWNDLYSRTPFDPINSNVKYQYLWRKLNGFYLIKTLRKVLFVSINPFIRNFGKTNISTFENFVPLEYERNLSEMLSQAHAKKTSIVLVTLASVNNDPPSQEALTMMHYPFFSADPKALLILQKQYNKSIEKMAERFGAHIVDNEKFVNSLPHKEQYFFDTMHMYCQGYKLMAENIYRELTNQGIIPRQ